jgi:hypothetical protein
MRYTLIPRATAHVSLDEDIVAPVLLGFELLLSVVTRNSGAEEKKDFRKERAMKSQQCFSKMLLVAVLLWLSRDITV